jgi:hypothetical protein
VDPNHNAIWIAEGTDLSYLGVFDGQQLYNVAWSNDLAATQRQWAQRVRARGALWVGTAMPGWDDTRLLERSGRYQRDRQNGAWYQQSWAAATATNPDWIVITSWNEFVENTHIEPSANYGSRYLDLTRTLAGAWKGVVPAQPAAQSVTVARATPTKTPPPALSVLPLERALVCSNTVIAYCLLRD